MRVTVLVEAILGLGGNRKFTGPRCGMGFGLGISWGCVTLGPALSYRMSGKALTEDPVHVPALFLHLPHQGELVPGTVQVVGGVGGAEVHVPV